MPSRFPSIVLAGWLVSSAAVCFMAPAADLPNPTLPLVQPARIPVPDTSATNSITPQASIAIVQKLADFGTRHTLSDTTSETRGIGAARNWVLEQFRAAGPRIQASLEEFDAPVGPRIKEYARVANVVAVLPGTDPAAANRRVYVVGHLDSMNANVMDPIGDAPGANDDASGCAVVIESARALAKENLRATVVFLCTIGEEQGLVGAKYHADSARARNENIVAVLNNDIVGDPSAPPTDGFDAQPTVIRVFSEGLPRNASAEQLARLRALSAESDSPSRQLARYVAEIAAIEKTAVQPRLVFRLDRFLRGGDHSMFNQAGFPAVRFTASNETYSRQHQNVSGPPQIGGGHARETGDVVRFVDPEYLSNVARLNAKCLINLANAPQVPQRARIITAKLENATTLRWDTSPDADGYEIVWRDTTSPMWTFARDVGNVTEITLPISKDDYFLGVRAYRKDGFRSIVAFADQGAE
ncbi:MAG: M20/M25/M40 family metallo-hydrolase [Phycisphaeraceae bacterium]|nr:M20/M25/M40 family metallo-hydrolase [Phycisphaeraceae bacterium]